MNNFSLINHIVNSPLMWDNVTATECSDSAIRQWRTRLHSCVKEKGGYFEHIVTFQFSSDRVYSCWRTANSWLSVL